MSKVVIRYRSGQQVEIEVEELTVRYSTTRGEMAVTAMEWRTMKPGPLYLGIEDIESVWEME